VRDGMLRLGGLVGGLVLCAAWQALGPTEAAAQYSGSSASSSSGSSIGSSLKEGWDKVTGAIVPKSKPAENEPIDDAVSLKSKGRPTSNVYVAVARLYEQSGKWAEAEKHYQSALKENPNDLAALLGYAHVKEEMGKPDEAIALYQKAAKAKPEEAAVFNNLGLCYARRGMYDEAIASLGRAILLQPKNPLYRNNITAVLVEKGRLQEAYSHQRAVFQTQHTSLNGTAPPGVRWAQACRAMSAPSFLTEAEISMPEAASHPPAASQTQHTSLNGTALPGARSEQGSNPPAMLSPTTLLIACCMRVVHSHPPAE